MKLVFGRQALEVNSWNSWKIFLVSWEANSWNSWKIFLVSLVANFWYLRKLAFGNLELNLRAEPLASLELDPKLRILRHAYRL